MRIWCKDQTAVQFIMDRDMSLKEQWDSIESQQWDSREPAECPRGQHDSATILTAEVTVSSGHSDCNYTVRSWSCSYNAGKVFLTKAISQRQVHFRREWQYIRNTSWAILQFHSDSGFFLEISILGIPQWGGTQGTQTWTFSIHITTYWCTLSVQKVPVAITIIKN